MAVNPLDVAQCLTSDDPVNPSETMALLASTLGPLLPGAGIPYNPDVPQIDGVIGSSANYVLSLPGGISTPNLSVPGATNILEFMQPILGYISTALIILGPIKIIIDIVIAIVNVFCAFPNPAKMIPAIVQLITAMIQLATLFPAAAGIVLLIELFKTIIMILSAILLTIVPKIELIIQNANTVATAFSPDETAVKGASDKICGLVQDALNDVGILAPVNSLLSLIASFMGLATGSLCASSCCNDCPKIVRNPPEGRLKILGMQDDGRAFLVELIDATYSENLNSAAQPFAEVGAPIPFFRAMEQVNPFLSLNYEKPSDGEPEGSFVEDIGRNEYIDAFRVMINKRLGQANVSTVAGSYGAVVVYNNPHGFMAGQEVYFLGSSFSGFGVVETVVNSTTIIAKMQNLATATVTLPVGNLVTHGIYGVASMTRGGIENNFNPIMTLGIIPGSSLPPSAETNYIMVVDENAVTNLESGCKIDVNSALNDYNASIDQQGGGANPASPFTSSFQDLLGIEPSALALDNVDALKAAIQSRLNSPLLPPDDIISLVKADSDKIGKLLERAICVSISATNSIFTSSAQALDISSEQKILLTFQPRSIGVNGGKPIMAGMPSTIDVRGIFTTTQGTLSDVQFDSETGTYTAELTSTSAGTAEIRAYFLTADVCSSPAQDAPRLGFPPKILEVRFIEGNLRPRRQGRQYLPSAGGRRR